MDKQLNYCPVRFQALLQPDGLAIQSDQQLLSFKQLDQMIDLLEKQLLLHGLKAGDRLVCIAPNSVNLIILQLTCLRSGVIFCPINPRFSAYEIHARLEILNTEFIWLEQIKSPADLTGLALDFSLNSKREVSLSALKINHQQVINIIFTSGSSGLPKAVMHNFSNHYYSALGSQEIIPLKSGDKNLLSLPLFHISGYATVIRTILAGATLILSDTKLNIHLLKKQKITHLSLVVTQLYRLLGKAEFQKSSLSIKHLLLGGSAFSKRLLKQTKQRGFTYHLSYGLTEMSSQVATSTNSQCLHILKNRELKIINDEILLRGKTRFVGYFNGLMANSLIPEKQWFASKDLGRKVGDKLQIIGRKDRLFISGGENIQPEEIEFILLGFPAVKQAYVVAIDDPTFGERPVAFIDWQDGKCLQGQLDHYLEDKLSSYKRPVHCFLLPPQTGLKVSLKELQQIAQTHLDKIKF